MTVTTHEVFGGGEVQGSAPVLFVHGPKVDADVVAEWDADNDGDFSEAIEDITSFVLGAEWQYGRDFPSNLTGKSSPGKLNLTLDNRDGRFSFFNQASPLTQDPFSLRTGRKIRIRTAEAPNPDPVLLAKDRFLGSGALGMDELGNDWTAQTSSKLFAREGDSAGATMAVPQNQDHDAGTSEHIATVDVGVDDYYVQARWRFVDRGLVGPNTGDSIGIVYRYVDADNYGLVRFSASNVGGVIELQEVNGGVLTTVDVVAVEYRPDDYLGLHVTPTTADVYHNGVLVLATTSPFNSTATHVGLFSNWVLQRPPSFQELYVWDRLPVPVEGILITGDVVSVTPSAAPGQPGTAELVAQGVLQRCAETEIRPPNSTGAQPPFHGPTEPPSGAGELAGSALGRVGLLHPPGQLDRGDVDLGSVGLSKTKALDAMRAYEETELGFVHEAPEGWVAFDARSARAGTPVASAWADSAEAGQFRYDSIEPFDWRRNIINRVETAVAPVAPELWSTQHEATGADVSITMPSAATADVGDLAVAVIASSMQASGQNWEQPPGWTEHRNAGAKVGKLRIYSKVMDEDDIGASVVFYDQTSETESWVAQLLGYKAGTWYGDIGQGVEVAEPRGLGPPHSQSRAVLGTNNPPVVFPPWAPELSLVTVYRGGMRTPSGSPGITDPNLDEFYSPNGFSFFSTITGGTGTGAAAMQQAFLYTNDEVIDPSSFLNDNDGDFTNFQYVEAVTIAVRGFAGDPPETQGGQKVTVEDTASQETHNRIATHELASGLFKDTADAEAYADAVLTQHADDRPIFKLGFTATLSAAYRAEAARRRLGDKIRLVATGNSGMGVAGDFHIENISHRITNGGKLWQTEWEVSPA